MRISVISCALGVAFLLAMAALHGSGFGHFTAQMTESDASAMLKDMFPILYLMPSLYLAVLSAFGILGVVAPRARRPICLILAVATLAAGALALLLAEWVQLLVMAFGAGLFVLSALTVGPSSEPVKN